MAWRGWDWDGEWRGLDFVGAPFFAGEVEPCINGQVAASGAYFGQDVQRTIDRLLRAQLTDGGWNCEAENGSTRSSFNTTICVLEALLEFELAGGAGAEVTESRLRGQEYLLERRLFRRLSTGEVIARDRKTDTDWRRFAFPTWWHYDVLRALDYLRKAGATPDERVSEAIELVESKRDAEGRWPLDNQYPGTMPVDVHEGEGQGEGNSRGERQGAGSDQGECEGDGQGGGDGNRASAGRPSRWNTLRALRVLKWYGGK